MTLIATATTRFGGVSVNQLVSHYTANYSAAAVLKARSKEERKKAVVHGTMIIFDNFCPKIID